MTRKAINPVQFDLLKKFLDWMEEERGLLLVDGLNGKSDQKNWINATPERGDRTYVEIFLSMRRISDSRLESDIEHFLKNIYQRTNHNEKKPVVG